MGALAPYPGGVAVPPGLLTERGWCETVWYEVCEVIVHSNVHSRERGEKWWIVGEWENHASVAQTLTNWAVVAVPKVSQSATE